MKILIAVLCLAFIPHEYHISLYNLNYNQETKKFEITQKLFVDDFEKALEIRGQKIIFGDDLMEEAVVEKATAYIKNNFSLKIDGQDVRLKFIGAEWEDNHGMLFYWESEPVTEVKTIDIFNTIFLEVSPEQQNMHHIAYGTQKPSLMLDATKTKGRVFLK